MRLKRIISLITSVVIIILGIKLTYSPCQSTGIGCFLIIAGYGYLHNELTRK